MKSINELIWDIEESDEQEKEGTPISINSRPPVNIGIHSCCSGGGCACVCRGPGVPQIHTR